MPLLQTSNLRLEGREAGVAVLWLDVADRSVNVLHRQLLEDLDFALDPIERDGSIRHLIIASAKPAGFLAGADVRELAAIRSAQEASEFSAKGQKAFEQLAKLAAVSVAVIHGPCLGGGMELALACDYRLAIDQRKTQLGLPEVELGLLPAWGGTQRLPRVVGLQQALRMILSSRRVDAREAGKLRLADQVLKDMPVDESIDDAIRFLHGKPKRPKVGLPRHTWRQVLVEGNPVGRKLIFRGAARLLKERVPDDMPAPGEALEAIRTGISKGMTAGLAFEREGAGRLAISTACRNLVGLFLQREEARKLPAELRDKARPIKKVGVVGGGTMGAGIAQLAALKGCQVVVQEVNTEALGAASLRIAELFRQAKEKGAIHTVEMVRGLNAIKGTLDWKGFDDVDLAIEAVVEDLEAKRAVFAELEKHCHHAIVATNTSSLLVEKLQEGRKHPGRVAGLHFFHPVHKMPLVEVVRGPKTDEATIATLMQWAIDAGKTPVAVKDSPGFVVNRVLMPYLHEARLLVEEKVERKLVDRIMRRFGMPMGPLEMIDMVGPNLVQHIEASMKPFFGKRLETERKQGKPPPGAAGVRDRLVLVMVNEAAACLAEGLTGGTEQIDLALVLGTGWAPHRGGPLRYADDRGLPEIVKTLEELARTYGKRFEPCAELRRRAEEKRPFYGS